MLAKLMALFLLGLIRVLTGSQARWYGCPPKAEQRIYFANHQSHADLVMIWAALPKELRHMTRAIAARDYWTMTPFKQWLTTEVFNVIYVSRERTADEDPLEPLLDALAKGDSIILFPEGTRGHTGEPQAFKAGLYNLALKFPQAVLVPAWINNVQHVLPKGFRRARNFGFLHPNSKRLISLLKLLVFKRPSGTAPPSATSQTTPRAQWKCACCAGAMRVLHRRILTSTAAPPPKQSEATTNQ